MHPPLEPQTPWGRNKMNSDEAAAAVIDALDALPVASILGRVAGHQLLRHPASNYKERRLRRPTWRRPRLPRLPTGWVRGSAGPSAVVRAGDGGRLGVTCCNSSAARFWSSCSCSAPTITTERASPAGTMSAIRPAANQRSRRRRRDRDRAVAVWHHPGGTCQGPGRMPAT